MVRPWLDILFKDIELVVIRQQFTTSPKDFILLCEITWKKNVGDPDDKLDELKKKIKYIDDIIIITTEKNNSKTLCFFKGIYDERYTELFQYTTLEFLCFIEYPMFFREKFGTFNLVGPPDDVNRLTQFMKDFGSEFEIIAVTNYYTKDKGILSVLTAKQLSTMQIAYEHGFFDHPRTSTARKIAKKLGIAHTTLLTHIRKSQDRIFSALFQE
jgi:predicted DNA binding protein